ncbi:tripartite ATP-independent transporter DctM subunit [Primorskyibacter sedentarius]|uniref:TRAP transporter large permease protein n=1 Tax=Primorskyibacter sedentarius TaxID=745311 RepID=A0A4R3JH10_9RHOB|nr:TRAP transporter large permease [Primorskyibacter sedentarius]TCS64603.1 tripartite ATP-independent transporter DctM subunit [Primorskyibacter sedentarius]
MDPTLLSVVLIVVLLAAVLLRAPIGLAMAAVGSVGYMLLSSPAGLAAYLSSAWPDRFLSYDLAIIPLFILMGHLATRTGISAALFAASNAWIGHWRGGLAMASVAGCAMFGSISGSSIATASTMAKVALPEMKKHNYSGALSSGSLAAGGTLGILIPPSIVLIIYALLTEQNIVKLFLAAMLPGLLAVVGFIIAIAIYVRLFPASAPLQERTPMRERFRSLGGIWHIISIFIIVLGGIYGGFFTPAEGASIGVVLTALAGLLTRTLTLESLIDSLVDTAGASAMIFVIIFGADLFNVAIALSRMPTALADWFAAADVAPMTVLILMIGFYLIMGCVMDSLSMIVLTVPVFFPTMMSLDFGLLAQQQALWLGILTLVVVEVGMITPPVGMNLFIISAIARDIPVGEIFRGTVPFIMAEGTRIVLLTLLPVLSYGLVDWWWG